MIRQALQKLLNATPKTFLSAKFSWRWLRFYPAVIPTEKQFDEWNQIEDPDKWKAYQAWIGKNTLSTFDGWCLLRQQTCLWKFPPKISIVTPVYNTQVDVLLECINSVRMQPYPYWQLILVDDNSSHPETHQFLQSRHCKDPRIHVYYCQQSQGISKATNLGIEKAQGDYVVFLDHDDRLALDALSQIAEEIRQTPEVDIIYSDRDMISPEGKRYMYLFKPDWSPETLLAGNYIFHLMCYRRSLLNSLGGLRAELDGSQDYDLILRAIETQPNVKHIQKILYHWRQYQGSVSLDSSAKDYAFEAGVRALNEAMQRRSIKGTAFEIKDFYRGNYQLDMECPSLQEIEIVSVDFKTTKQGYGQIIQQSIEKTNSDCPFIALISPSLTPKSKNAIPVLAAWLKLEGVGIASGGIDTGSGLIEYAGATYSEEGDILTPYQGSPVNEVGYMAMTKLVRNISAPHPFCVVIRREVWQQLAGFNQAYEGFYTLFDFTLRALEKKWRCVSVPHAKFISPQVDLLANYYERDKQLFRQHWQVWLEKGDPYYNSNLVRESKDQLFHVL